MFLSLMYVYNFKWRLGAQGDLILNYNIGIKLHNFLRESKMVEPASLLESGTRQPNTQKLHAQVSKIL